MRPLSQTLGPSMTCEDVCGPMDVSVQVIRSELPALHNGLKLLAQKIVHK